MDLGAWWLTLGPWGLVPTHDGGQLHTRHQPSCVDHVHHWCICMEVETRAEHAWGRGLAGAWARGACDLCPRPRPCSQPENRSATSLLVLSPRILGKQDHGTLSGHVCIAIGAGARVWKCSSGVLGVCDSQRCSERIEMIIWRISGVCGSVCGGCMGGWPGRLSVRGAGRNHLFARYWYEYCTCVCLRASLQSRSMHAIEARVALGVLSAAPGLDQRQRFRAGSVAHSVSPVSVRFLVAAKNLGYNATAMLMHEQASHGDLLLLHEMEESRFLCALKYILWFEHCATAYPRAHFWALADIDTHINLDHLDADLMLVDHRVPVLYGLIMWHCYYNEKSMVTHWCWGNWLPDDRLAVLSRVRIEACAHALRSGANLSSMACSLCKGTRGQQCSDRLGRVLQKPDLESIKMGAVSSFPPFPFANGPLFAASPALGRLLLRSSLPRAFLARLLNLPEVKAVAKSSKRRNLGGVRTGCYPAADSLLGYWISAVAITARTGVTLVNTPFMRQHHPWPMGGRNGSYSFSNASIVLHTLKSARQEPLRQAAIMRGSGPFKPTPRTCASCEKMGWCRWTGGPCINLNWTCCGEPTRKAVTLGWAKRPSHG